MLEKGDKTNDRKQAKIVNRIELRNVKSFKEIMGKGSFASKKIIIKVALKLSSIQK